MRATVHMSYAAGGLAFFVLFKIFLRLIPVSSQNFSSDQALQDGFVSNDFSGP